MNPDIALNVAEACVRASQEFWGLYDGTSVTVRIGATENLKASGECEAGLKYRRATITLNPLHIEDFAELWQVTAHEMAHVVLGEFDHFYEIVETTESSQITYDFVRERACVLLERVFLKANAYPGDKEFE